MISDSGELFCATLYIFIFIRQKRQHTMNSESE